jgi:uncharacterized protein
MTETTGTETGPPPASPPERYPFWDYMDLLLFVGLAFASMLFAMAVASLGVWAFGVPRQAQLFVLVPAQFLGWGLMFASLALMLRARYDRPFWASLRWTPAGIPPAAMVLAGVGLAFAVALLSVVLKTPDIDSPMKEYLSRGPSIVLLALFGTTVGPLCEELAFRGFAQPLFVRSLGPVPGVLLAALPFGLLHLQQYSWSWRHGLLITVAGAGFGWMRQATGSTRAAVVMHMAYNCAFFVALLAQRKEFPHTW